MDAAFGPLLVLGADTAKRVSGPADEVQAWGDPLR